MNTAVFGDLSEIQRTILVVCFSMVPFWIKRKLRGTKKSTEDDGDGDVSEEPRDNNHHRQKKNMRFKVTVPEQCSSGETVRIILADGTEANVTIPSDRAGGDSFVFELPTETVRDPDGLLRQKKTNNKQQQSQSHSQSQSNKSSKRKQKKQQAGGGNAHDGAHPITEIATIPDRGGGGDDDDDDSIPITHASLHLGDDSGHSGSGGGDDDGAAKGSSSSSSSLVGGIHHEDFVMALAVGLLVGAAIVIGFLVGILHATEEIYAVHPIEKPKVDPRKSAAKAAQKRFPRGNPSKPLPRFRGESPR